MSHFLLSSIVIAGIVNFVSSILILRGLAKHDVNVSFFEIRWQIHKHLKTYRRLCRTANGAIEWPYYAYWISLTVMISAATVLFATLTTQGQ
ncbi:MAG: hypothetical protein P1P74_09760 [Desulfuromonadales bacterium]|nr:hypothetical protein [Desulfuromonadales bacterium]